MRDVVILRDLGATRTGGIFGPACRSREVDISARGRAVPEPSVEVGKQLSNREIRDIARDEGVVAMAPRMPLALIRPRASRAAAGAGDSWGLAAVGADASPFTGQGVTVAILDSGIDASHPAFAGVELVEHDFTGSGNGDKDGHGTHCAGTVFGRDVDGVRIGVARGVQRALIGKVLDDDGFGTCDMLYSGMRWAEDGGAQVISLSLGFDFPGLVKALTARKMPIEAATSQALEAYGANLRLFDSLMRMLKMRAEFGGGAVVVAASGNESRRLDHDPPFEIATSLPAAAEDVLSVAAASPGENGFGIAEFSNVFPELAAPGVDILSAKVGGGLHALSGTSMAGPHVAGVAALWWEKLASRGVGGVSAASVANRLLNTARADVFAPDLDEADRGQGLVTAP